MIPVLYFFEHYRQGYLVIQFFASKSDAYAKAIEFTLPVDRVQSFTYKDQKELAEKLTAIRTKKVNWVELEKKFTATDEYKSLHSSLHKHYKIPEPYASNIILRQWWTCRDLFMNFINS